jgi:DNA-binding MarR family transcriptional regulator
MTSAPGGNHPAEDTAATAREAWALMSDLVLDHERRREAADALGMSFARVRAVRRIAQRPMSMREIAALLDIDPANATPVVDDLESLGLVRRRPHPTDRRAKLVEATRKGKQAARKADEILFTPPPGLAALNPGELETLLQLLRRAAGS